MLNEAHMAQRDLPSCTHPKPGAPRRLRWTAREGGVAHRHRWREQPPGAEDRADRRLVDDRGGARVEKSRAAARKPPNVRRLGGRETPLPLGPLFAANLTVSVTHHSA